MESSPLNTPLSTSITENSGTVEGIHPHLDACPTGFDCDLPLETPYKVTIDMYKERCGELETELVRHHAAAVAKNLEIESLKTKIAMLTEYYHSLDKDTVTKEEASLQSKGEAPSPSPPPASVLRLALRCAELEAALNAKQPPHDSPSLVHSKNTVTENKCDINKEQQGKTSVVAGPELLALLRSACRQLEEARRVGSQLRLKLARGKTGSINYSNM